MVIMGGRNQGLELLHYVPVVVLDVAEEDLLQDHVASGKDGAE